MTRDYLILIGLFTMVIAACVLMIKNGIPTTQRLCWGIFGLVMLSLLAVGIHCLLDADGSLADMRKPAISLQNIGLGVLFLGLAAVGLLCAEHRE